MRPGQPLTRRLFIAFRLPGAVVEALSSWQSRALGNLSGLRPTLPAQLHVTAVFLGLTPAADVHAVTDLIRHTMRPARQPIFRIDRYHETARVGMLTLREELVGHDQYVGRASQLAGHLMVALESSGRYVREFRSWRPHITVARFRAAPRLRLEPPPLAPFAPTDVALYESTLGQAGSTYTVVEAFAFRDEPAVPPVRS